MTSVDLLADLLSVTPGWARQRAAAGLDDAATGTLLREAAGLAQDRLAPLAPLADATGCRIEDGRVVTPDGYAAAYAQLGASGWIAADLPKDRGGRGLPLALRAATSLQFDGAALPFMLLAGASQAAAHCLAARAPDLADAWVPKLASGAWTASLCLTEPDAGSDPGRIRTTAVETAGGWRISGTKSWVSFGDHDVAGRIGHMTLARTGAPDEGIRGLSLFLVPDTAEDGARTGVAVERIEQTLGLRGAPACVLRFDDAPGRMIGPQGRGLNQLSAMIDAIRLQTACQGAGVALRCCGIARDHAGERRQGGPPGPPPPPIVTHADVRRQLTAMETEASIVTALVLDLAATLQDAQAGDPEAAHRAAFLLPLARTFAAEAAFRVASDALQVLGAAGYSRDGAVERHLRDSRALSLYAGTTGIGAKEFIRRRLLRDDGVGLSAFATAAEAELARRADRSAAALAGKIIARFEALSAHLGARRDEPDRIDLVADAYMRAAWECVSAVLACRLTELGGDHNRRGHFWLRAGMERFAVAEAGCRLTPDYLT